MILILVLVPWVSLDSIDVFLSLLLPFLCIPFTLYSFGYWIRRFFSLHFLSFSFFVFWHESRIVLLWSPLPWQEFFPPKNRLIPFTVTRMSQKDCLPSFSVSVNRRGVLLRTFLFSFEAKQIRFVLFEGWSLRLFPSWSSSSWQEKNRCHIEWQPVEISHRYSLWLTTLNKRTPGVRLSCPLWHHEDLHETHLYLKKKWKNPFCFDEFHLRKNRDLEARTKEDEKRDEEVIAWPPLLCWEKKDPVFREDTITLIIKHLEFDRESRGKRVGGNKEEVRTEFSSSSLET